MKWYRLAARISHSGFSFLKKLTYFLDAFHSGFWLGVMGRKSLDYTDELYYNRTKSYSTDLYNESGFFNWEKPVIEKHFGDVRTIMVIAAGGGREVLALSKLGISVEGFECNQKLVSFGNSLLIKNNVPARINFLPRNTVPQDKKQYDGLIIGWGAYSHMEGRERRVSFLKDLKPFLHKSSKLMISFLYVTNRSRRDRVVVKVSNFFRTFTRKFKTETGDRLEPDYIHYFIEEEIKNELTTAGYRITDYSQTDYGCIVAGLEGTSD